MPAISDIGIDLGTSTISVYVRGKGIILREPSLVAYDKDADKVRAIGDEARSLIGHTAGTNIAVRPLAQGRITDFMITERLIKYFVEKSMGRRRFLKPRIAVCVPSGVTEIEKKAVVEATYQAGARDVTLVPEPLAAAIGSELDVTKPEGTLVVDVGGSLTDIAVISLCGIVVSSSVMYGGDDLTRAIVSYLRDNYGIFIGEQTAESIKLRLGSVNSTFEGDQLTVNGRSRTDGLPKSVILTREDVDEALVKAEMRIIEAVRSLLERTPPDLAGDLQKRGVLLAGGGSQAAGLAELLEDQTGLHVMAVEHPDTVVALGCGRYNAMLSDFEGR